MHGFIQDPFQPSYTYGECVGPITFCSISADCPNFQSCDNGFCQCPASVGDLCVKDGVWQCVQDPISEVSL